jgi:hypothetical protein
MTTLRDPDAILAAWLDEGPTRLPEQTRRAIAVALPMTSQERRASVPWRSTTMSDSLKLAFGAVAVVAVVLGGAMLLGPPGGNGVGGAPTPSPPPTEAIETTDWVPFSSDRYGFDLTIPSTWTASRSTRAWSLDIDRTDWLTPAADRFMSPGSNLLFTVFAAPLPARMSSDAWIAAYLAPGAGASPGPCAPTARDLGQISVDGRPATFWAEPDEAACGGSHAFVVVDDRIYVFTVWRSGNEPLLKAFLSTVRFRPAADAASTTGPVAAVWWGELAPAVAPYGGSRRLLEAFLSTMNVWPDPAFTG